MVIRQSDVELRVCGRVERRCSACDFSLVSCLGEK